MNFKKLIVRKWVALVLIVVVSFVANQFILDLKDYQKRDNTVKEFIQIVIIVIVYALGVVGLSNNLKQWLKKSMVGFVYFFYFISDYNGVNK